MVQSSRRKSKSPNVGAGENRSTTPAQFNSDVLWRLVSVAFGALIVLGFLMPADAVSVFAGEALPQNLGWLVLGVVAAIAAHRSQISCRLRRPERVVLVATFGWLLGCTYWLSHHHDGRAIWNSFWQLMALASCYFIGRALLQFARVHAAMLLILLVGCTALAVDGLQQVFITMPTTRRAFEKDPERMLAEQGIDAPPGSPTRKQFEDRLYSPEPFATFALANSLGTLLSFGVVLTSGWLAMLLRELNLSHRTEKANKSHAKLVLYRTTWLRIFAVVFAILVQLACLLLTRSRSAYLALLFSLSVWLMIELLRNRAWFSPRVMRIGGVVITLTVTLILVWLFTFDQRVLSEATKSLGYRVEYWQATLAMIRDHGLTGVGLGNFQAYYPFYKVEIASEIIADPHNWILDIAATLSLPIAVVTIAWLVTTIAIGTRNGLTQPEIFAPSNRLASATEQSLASGMLTGAVVGGAFEMLFLWMIGNLDPRYDTFSWAVAALVGWQVWRAGMQLPIRNSCLVAATIATLTALLVSGSWQASGIAIPFLCICAGLRVSSRDPKSADDVEISSAVGSRWWWAPTFAVVGCAIFGFQTWQPVMQSWAKEVQAQSTSSYEEKLQLIAEAANIDPLNRDFPMQLAQLHAALAESAVEPESFSEHAQLALDQILVAMARDNAGPTTPKMAGQVCLDLAASANRLHLPNVEYLDLSKGYYSTALKRYPSSIELLVQYSLSAALVGDRELAASTAELAIQTSSRIPHADKKLESQLVWLPLQPTWFEETALDPLYVGSRQVRAEPLATWLRKLAK